MKMRRSKMKGFEYSAIVCPACDTIMGQMFISCIRTGGPPKESRPAGDPRQGKPQKQRQSIEPAALTYCERPTICSTASAAGR